MKLPRSKILNIFYLIYLILIGFCIEPSNNLGFQKAAIISLIISSIYFLCFTTNIKLILAHILLVTTSSSQMIDFMPKSSLPGINYSNMITVLSILIYFVKFRPYAVLYKFKKLHVFYLLLLIWMILDIYTYLISENSVVWSPIIGIYIKLFSLLLFSSQLAYIEEGKDSTDTILIIISGIGGISFNYGFKLFTGNEISNYSKFMIMRAEGYLDPNYIAIIVSGLLILFCINLLYKRHILLSLAGFLISFISILGTGSRTGLISFMASLIVIIYIGINSIYSQTKAPIMILIFSLIFISSTFSFINKVPLPIKDRFTKIKAGYSEARELCYINAISFIKREPIAGNGKEYYLKGNSIIKAGAHNTFLNMFAEGGVLFLLVFIFFISNLFKFSTKIDASPEKEIFIGFLTILCISSLGLTISIGDFIYTTYITIITFLLNKFS